MSAERKLDRWTLEQVAATEEALIAGPGTAASVGYHGFTVGRLLLGALDVQEGKTIPMEEAFAELRRTLKEGEREVVRAWVARSESGALGAFAEKPTRLDSLSGVWWNGKATWLPSSWLPTLAPGECWPVEIRRVTE